MKWALDSGYGFGCCEVAAQLAGNVVEHLEREAQYTVKALELMPMHDVRNPSAALTAVVNQARQAAYAGGSITPYAAAIDRLWQEFSRELGSKPTLAWRIGPAFLAGINLGAAYMRCYLRLQHPATIQNLDGALLWLGKLRNPSAGNQPPPGFIIDFNAKIAEIKSQYQSGGSAGLPTVADFIDALRGNIKDQFPPP